MFCREGFLWFRFNKTASEMRLASIKLHFAYCISANIRCDMIIVKNGFDSCTKFTFSISTYNDVITFLSYTDSVNKLSLFCFESGYLL